MPVIGYSGNIPGGQLHQFSVWFQFVSVNREMWEKVWELHYSTKRQLEMKKLILTGAVLAIISPSMSAVAEYDFSQYTNQELFRMGAQADELNKQELRALHTEQQWRAQRMDPDDLE
ncbi:MAG: hypothetical protein U9Q71_00115, partial [Pseudomonadota bacterium]|nr:hypothetical protein [Pseudomonadota bacterium]